MSKGTAALKTYHPQRHQQHQHRQVMIALPQAIQVSIVVFLIIRVTSLDTKLWGLTDGLSLTDADLGTKLWMDSHLPIPSSRWTLADQHHVLDGLSLTDTKF